ncbi:MAG TPA: TIM barrel protein, partial [Pyrinomonadaceae bacterium]|nr:TIM barrel protein [Pyrinomonadaceae bacterium]
RAALDRYREAIDLLAQYCVDSGYDIRFALEPKPNEPRGDILLPTVGHALAFVDELEWPEMVGLNPEFAHETMTGLNFVHAVADALAAGKLFHIDLNDQRMARFDQDFRFASENPKRAFFLVKLLEESGYDGPRHFDAHAYRTEDYEGVKEFARGCMRTYLILKDKAARWNADPEIKALLAEIIESKSNAPPVGTYQRETAATLLAHDFDRIALAARGLQYERLDQLTMDLLLGVR